MRMVWPNTKLYVWVKNIELALLSSQKVHNKIAEFCRFLSMHYSPEISPTSRRKKNAVPTPMSSIQFFNTSTWEESMQ